MIAADVPAAPQLSDAQRQRLAVYADLLICGGSGLPSASAADVQGKWIDRTMAVRADLAEVVLEVLALPGEPADRLRILRERSHATFDRFAYAIAGSYLMNPKVRKGLGLPGTAPKPKPALPDESDHYLEGDILGPVLDRGPIYRPTPPATT